MGKECVGLYGGMSGSTQVSHDANVRISVDVLCLQGYNSTYRRKSNIYGFYSLLVVNTRK